MNERPALNRLREAMRNADSDPMEAEEVGRQAVAIALAVAPPEPKPERLKPMEDEERQRVLDEALADAITMVVRQRARLGRRVCSTWICSTSDARLVRQIHELLRGMGTESTAESDRSFQ